MKRVTQNGMFLLALTIVCILGTFIIMTSQQSQFGISGAAVGTGNVTINITPIINVVLTSSSIDFGTMIAGNSNNTTDDDPVPFAIENNGTVNMDITITMNASLFSGTGTGNNSTTFQYRAGNCSAAACGDAEADCFDWDNSKINWTPFTLEAVEVIDSLEYNDSKDETEVEIYLYIPVDEPGGNKSSIITFTASEEI